MGIQASHRETNDNNNNFIFLNGFDALNHYLVFSVEEKLIFSRTEFVYFQVLFFFFFFS